MPTHLKIYHPVDEDIDTEETFPGDPAIRVRLGDLLPLVAVAQKRHFIWLKDFLDDEIAISDDLYDVLQAFRSSRPSA